MKKEGIVARLEANRGVVRTLCDGVTQDDAAWRPAPGRWSLLEIINHLADEEREDFRLRIDFTLHRPGETWPGIDPPAWVEERKYAERDFGESIEDWSREREKSIAWLRRLEPPDWEPVYEHPKLGPIRAGDLLASWLAHDLLHIRQMTRLHFDRIREVADRFSTGYAGVW